METIALIAWKSSVKLQIDPPALGTVQECVQFSFRFGEPPTNGKEMN